MATFKIELPVDTRNIRFWPVAHDPRQGLLETGRQCIEFQLCKKQFALGPHKFEQFWMAKPTLDPSMKRRASNYQGIVAAYWALCWETDAVLDDGAQQTYTLANLLPYIRAKSCRKIFCDANSALERPEGDATLVRRRQSQIEKLELLLMSSRSQRINIIEFRDHTAEFVGPPFADQFTDDVRLAYRSMSSELLGRTQWAMERLGDDGLKVAEQIWNKWMRDIGRRRGGSTEKKALDILSVEIRASFWRAYSAVWCRLIDELTALNRLNESARLFHAFWHLAHRCEAMWPGVYFHAFRGCPPALHPAMATFIQTHTGKELLGAWLSRPDNQPRLQQLLHGLLTAVLYYSGRISETALLRRQV